MHGNLVSGTEVQVWERRNTTSGSRTFPVGFCRLENPFRGAACAAGPSALLCSALLRLVAEGLFRALRPSCVFLFPSHQASLRVASVGGGGSGGVQHLELPVFSTRDTHCSTGSCRPPCRWGGACDGLRVGAGDPRASRVPAPSLQQRGSS